MTFAKIHFGREYQPGHPKTHKGSKTLGSAGSPNKEACMESSSHRGVCSTCGRQYPLAYGTQHLPMLESYMQRTRRDTCVKRAWAESHSERLEVPSIVRIHEVHHHYYYKCCGKRQGPTIPVELPTQRQEPKELALRKEGWQSEEPEPPVKKMWTKPKIN